MMLIGSMMALIERNGGVGGLIRPVKAALQPAQRAPSRLGMGQILIESTVTLLVAGAVAVRYSTASALPGAAGYLINSTSAPVCILIPQMSGAINLGPLENAGLNDPLGVFVSAIPLNIYAFSAVAFAAATIAFGWLRTHGR